MRVTARNGHAVVNQYQIVAEISRLGVAAVPMAGDELGIQNDEFRMCDCTRKTEFAF
jgi:hypothetical protein